MWSYTVLKIIDLTKLGSFCFLFVTVPYEKGMRESVTNLVLYAQSTSTVISENERTNERFFINEGSTFLQYNTFLHPALGQNHFENKIIDRGEGRGL